MQEPLRSPSPSPSPCTCTLRCSALRKIQRTKQKNEKCVCVAEVAELSEEKRSGGPGGSQRGGGHVGTINGPAVRQIARLRRTRLILMPHPTAASVRPRPLSPLWMWGPSAHALCLVRPRYNYVVSTFVRSSGPFPSLVAALSLFLQTPSGIHPVEQWKGSSLTASSGDREIILTTMLINREDR